MIDRCLIEVGNNVHAKLGLRESILIRTVYRSQSLYCLHVIHVPRTTSHCRHYRQSLHVQYLHISATRLKCIINRGAVQHLDMIMQLFMTLTPSLRTCSSLCAPPQYHWIIIQLISCAAKALFDSKCLAGESMHGFVPILMRLLCITNAIMPQCLHCLPQPKFVSLIIWQQHTLRRV